MADQTMAELFDEYENVKYESKPAKKMRKKISKVLVLNEMEQQKAKGIKENLKTVFSFIKSGNPTLPDFKGTEVVSRSFEGDQEVKKTIEEMSLFEKIISVPACIILLPIVALKMGINTVKLAKWMLEKKELVEELEKNGLLDNVKEYAEEDKKRYENLNTQEYMDHLLAKEDFHYNELMDEMSEEIHGKGKAA